MNAVRDANNTATLLGISSVDGITPVPIRVDPITGAIMCKIISGNQFSPLTTKGDIYTYSTTQDRLPVGTNGQILIADSSQPTGLRWSTAGAGSGDVVGPVSSTDNAIARFDGITGKLIQNSTATIADTTGDITAGKYNTVAISGSSTPTLAVTGTTAVSGTNTGDNATNTQYSGLAASKEDVSNKSISITTDQASNIKYPSVKSVYDWAIGLFSTITGAQTLTNKSISLGTNTITGTIAEFNTACTDADFATGGGTATGTNTGNETTTTIGALINGATAKTTPVDADMVGLMDSAASNVVKKLSWLNIKATLKAYFDTVYAQLAGSISQVFAVSQLEIGHATDTTITRVSAGVIAVEGKTLANLTDTQTFGGVQTFAQVICTNNAITATANAATVPVTFKTNTVTNNSAATLTITLTTSGAVNRQIVEVCVLDFSAVVQTIAWVNTENSTISVPTSSNGSTTLPLSVLFQYNTATTKWRCIGIA